MLAIWILHAKRRNRNLRLENFSNCNFAQFVGCNRYEVRCVVKLIWHLICWRRLTWGCCQEWQLVLWNYLTQTMRLLLVSCMFESNLNIKTQQEHEANMCRNWPREQPKQKKSKMKTLKDRTQSYWTRTLQCLTRVSLWGSPSYPKKLYFRQFRK